MNDKQQIEVMAKEERVAELRLFYDYCKYNGCEEKTADDCNNCYFNEVYNKLAVLENKIRNGTLKELPENAVVIPEKITEETSPEDIIKIAKYNEKIRKKMAKEIFDKIIWFAVKRIGETSGDSYYQISFDRLKELAKHYNVEVDK